MMHEKNNNNELKCAEWDKREIT